MLLGLTFGAFLPVDSFQEVAVGLLTIVGFAVSITVPTMALTVSTLRAGDRSPKELHTFKKALNTQFTFWVSILVTALICAGALVIGSAMSWNGPSFQVFELCGFGPHVGTMQTVNSAVVASLVLLFLKASPFVRGFRSILNLHIDQVIDESRSIRAKNAAQTAREISEREQNSDFGNFVDKG